MCFDFYLIASFCFSGCIYLHIFVGLDANHAVFLGNVGKWTGTNPCKTATSSSTFQIVFIHDMTLFYSYLYHYVHYPWNSIIHMRTQVKYTTVRTQPIISGVNKEQYDGAPTIQYDGNERCTQRHVDSWCSYGDKLSGYWESGSSTMGCCGNFISQHISITCTSPRGTIDWAS